jgi:hypothetical protein
MQSCPQCGWLLCPQCQQILKSGCTTPRALPSNSTSTSKAKLTRTIQPMKPTSWNAKRLTCWRRFGVPVLFAVSGMSNMDSARSAHKNHPDHRLAPSLLRPDGSTGATNLVYFIPSAMTGFIVSVFPFRNRVSSQEAFEGLELGEGKPSRPVPRGPGGRKAAWLLGSPRRQARTVFAVAKQGAQKCTHLRSHRLQRNSWNSFGRNDGDDGTRTPGLCRDSSFRDVAHSQFSRRL